MFDNEKKTDMTNELTYAVITDTNSESAVIMTDSINAKYKILRRLLSLKEQSIDNNSTKIKDNYIDKEAIVKKRGFTSPSDGSEEENYENRKKENDLLAICQLMSGDEQVSTTNIEQHRQSTLNILNNFTLSQTNTGISVAHGYDNEMLFKTLCNEALKLYKNDSFVSDVIQKASNANDVNDLVNIADVIKDIENTQVKTFSNHLFDIKYKNDNKIINLSLKNPPNWSISGVNILKVDEDYVKFNYNGSTYEINLHSGMLYGLNNNNKIVSAFVEDTFVEAKETKIHDLENSDLQTDKQLSYAITTETGITSGEVIVIEDQSSGKVSVTKDDSNCIYTVPYSSEYKQYKHDLDELCSSNVISSEVQALSKIAKTIEENIDIKTLITNEGYYLLEKQLTWPWDTYGHWFETLTTNDTIFNHLENIEEQIPDSQHFKPLKGYINILIHYARFVHKEVGDFDKKDPQQSQKIKNHFELLANLLKQFNNFISSGLNPSMINHDYLDQIRRLYNDDAQFIDLENKKYLLDCYHTAPIKLLEIDNHKYTNLIGVEWIKASDSVSVNKVIKKLQSLKNFSGHIFDRGSSYTDKYLKDEIGDLSVKKSSLEKKIEEDKDDSVKALNLIGGVKKTEGYSEAICEEYDQEYPEEDDLVEEYNDVMLDKIEKEEQEKYEKTPQGQKEKKERERKEKIEEKQKQEEIQKKREEDAKNEVQMLTQNLKSLEEYTLWKSIVNAIMSFFGMKVKYKNDKENKAAYNKIVKSLKKYNTMLVDNSIEELNTLIKQKGEEININVDSSYLLEKKNINNSNISNNLNNTRSGNGQQRSL